MHYAEFPAPASLHRHVQCAWRLADPDPDGRVETVYPDGRCELIVHRGQPMARLDLDHGWQVQDRTLFAGQLTAAIRLAARGPLDCIGIRLQPAASACVVDHPGRFIDRVDDLAAIDAAFSRDLAMAAAAFDHDPTALWSLLGERLSVHPLDPRIESAVNRIEDGPASIRIENLAGELGMSLRGFQMGFRAQVGLSPKVFARIQRLQATLQALDRQPGSLAVLAAETGFADQAHATRELARLTGLTPARLRHALVGARDEESTLRMAAAFVRGAG